MSLRQTVQDIIADSENVDVYTLTTLTLAKVKTREDRARAFEQALPAFIRAMILDTRPTTTRPSQGHVDTHSLAAGAGATPTRSTKVTAIREAWRKHLDAIYTTQDGTQRRLAQFTASDLAHLAEVCEDLARANISKAARWTRLAALVEEAGVDTLGDLPDAALEAEFTRH